MESYFKTNSLKKVSVGDFMGYLFCIRDEVHLTHLAQPDKSLATHEVLDDLYKEILGFIDSLVEKYQGIYGIVPITIPATKASTNPLEMVTEKYKYIQEYRSIFKESWMQNIIDQIADLLATTLYKLKFVK